MEKKAEEKGKLEGLPVESSPYTQYKDLEDYKKQGYGTEGHQQPVIGRGAASSTDAPTNTPAVGIAGPTQPQQLSPADASRHGVP